GQASHQRRQLGSVPCFHLRLYQSRPKIFCRAVIPGNAAGSCGDEGLRRKWKFGAKTKTGLRAPTSAHCFSGFQQRADEHPRKYFTCLEPHGADKSLAQFARGGGEIGGESGGNCQRPRLLPSPGERAARANLRHVEFLVTALCG